jgi:hypothetical protein
MMVNSILSAFYARDIRKLIEEISLFRHEENLWKIHGTMKNSSGNLALHLIGGTNFLIGTQLGQTGYVRNRDQEFSIKGVPRSELIAQLEALVPMVTSVLQNLTQREMDEEYPLVFDGAKRSKNYVLIQLLAHLNYHLGQINYLRRSLE